MNSYFAPWALLPEGWRRDVRIAVSGEGTIEAVTPGSAQEGATLLKGPVLAGMPNAHSHVAQRALAGRAERAGPDGEGFWGWRETMYAFVDALDPDSFEAIAAATYAEMLEAGYTSVAEFHYLHHGPDGVAYERASEMSERLLAAAERAGIGLTLLPTLYRYSDFGNRPPEARQARFVTSPDAFLALWDQTRELARERPNVRLGAGIHSLRAASLDDVRRIVAAIDERVPLPPYDPAEEDAPVPDTPLHIHISEQRREVAACRAKHLGTPIELLGNAVELGPRWSLVHATHATPAELLSIATSGAVVVLCPSTEANLGDGIFPAHDFSKQRGRIAIGSDSGVTLNVAEELRWFEYVQRLATGFRHVMDPRPKFGRPLGEALYERATSAGMQALDQPIGVIAEDCRADLIVLEPFEDEPALDIYLFRSGAWQVRDVIAGGRIVVREGRHVDSEELQRRGAQAVRALLERV